MATFKINMSYGPGATTGWGYGVRHCHAPRDICDSNESSCCPVKDRECKEVAFFPFSRFSMGDAWNAAVAKVKELNPGGALETGKVELIAPHQHGRPEEIVKQV